MDRTIDKKPAPLKRWVLIALGASILIVLAWQLLSRTTGASRLKIDSSRLTTAVVQNGEFLEYYPFDGTVQPAISVFLDIEGGGRVDQIFVEGGQHVEKGDLILRFSNASLRQSALNTETQLLYNLDIQRTTLFNRQQSTLLLKDALLDLDHQILDYENKFRRYDALMKNGNTAISVAEYETTRDQLKYLKDRRVLMAERIRREDELAESQLAQANRAIEKLNTGIGMIGQIVASLDVRAPIAGWLSTIDAQVGQSIPAGKRIGQIDLLDKFKVRVKIDQYYISRVEIGTKGHVDLDGRTWDVVVQKIYPEVKDSAFEADVVFEGESPAAIKRGQTLTIELSFGTPSRSLKVAKGGFYQQTSGRWVYLVSEDGRSARRTNVRLGRQNPREVEVLEGLREGDRIITSGYDTYNGVDELRFKDPLKKKQEKS
ncbi:MAG: HlyD family efflux transporter periplasmic adaptor subunit [Pseudomonadota bacterium]